MVINSEIEHKVEFDKIRYAQLWEDADILTQGLGNCKNGTLVSICSAGDNALAMLTLDPKKIVVLDLSKAQISCLKLRMGAYQNLSHPEFLELMGSRPSNRRAQLLKTAIASLDIETQTYWQNLNDEVIKYGAGGIGKFEHYFRIFRAYLLPLVHSKYAIDDVFIPRDKKDRQAFLDTKFNTFRWKLLLNIFFSRFMMGHFGRDKAFFDHVKGSPAQHVARRIHHAAVECCPSENPYLHWILKGTHGTSLPMPWRLENFDAIKSRLNRIEIRHGSLETAIATGERYDGFNLSDIFEYMSPEVFETVYGEIIKSSNPNARLVYWNMMAPRRAPKAFNNKVSTKSQLENSLKKEDKAFFYSDFVIEEIRV